MTTVSDMTIEQLLDLFEKRKHERIRVMGLDYPAKLLAFYDEFTSKLYEAKYAGLDARVLQQTGQTFLQRQAVIFAKEAWHAMERGQRNAPMRRWYLLEFPQHYAIVYAYGFAHAVQEAEFVGLNIGGRVDGRDLPPEIVDEDVIDHSYRMLNGKDAQFLEALARRLPEEEAPQ